MRASNNQTQQEVNTPIEGDTGQVFKKSNLFFIKSKHAFRQYKNHDYFEDHKDIIDKHLNYRSRQFVQSPAPYGISNAYEYICEEISKNNIRKYNTTQKKFRTIHERYDEQKNRKSQTCHKQKRKTHFTLPNLEESKKQIKHHLLTQKLASRHQSESRQKFNRTTFKNTQRKSQHANSPETQKKKKEYFINLIYVDAEQSVSRLHSFEIRLNIHNYIINTFLKAKINYSDLTQQQFRFLIGKILEIFGTQREHMQYKDLVNLRSTKEIFDFLSAFTGKQTEVKQTLRYFFVAKQEVYEYQLNRLKDQIKDRLQFQFQNSAGIEGIYMFDIHSGSQITNLHELIKHNQSKFIVGVDKNVWEIYHKFTKEENSRKKLVNRVNQWKSIISEKTHTELAFKPIPTEKYQSLFENVQKKRAKMNRNRKKCEISLKNSQFINRQALFKDQNIFQ